jgi:hypothetical protein
VKNGLAIDIHHINHQPIIEVHIIPNRETESARGATVELTLMAVFVNFGDNRFIDVIVACPIKDFVQAVSSRVAESPV